MKNSLSAYFNERHEQRLKELDAELLQIVSAGLGENYMLQRVDGLLKKGARVSARDSKTGDTPLHMAAARNYAKLAQRLLAAKADPEDKNAEGKTPLLCAAGRCAAAAIKTLLTAGAKVQATRGDDGKHGAVDALLQASFSGLPPGFKFDDMQLTSLQSLMEHGATLNNDDRRTIWCLKQHLFPALPDMAAVHKFCQAGINRNWKTVEQMLGEGMKPDAPADFGAITPLMSAAMEGNLGMIDKLLAAGADPNRRGGPWTTFDHWASPLQAALCYGHRDAAVKLLDGGGNPRQEIRNGEWQPLTLENLVGRDAAAFIESESLRRGMGTRIGVGKPLQLKTPG